MEESHSPLNGLSSVLGEYLGMRTDDFKKSIISGLSVGFSRTLSVLVMVMLLMIVLAVFAVGFIMLLGDAIGSWSGAAFIVGGIYLMALMVVFLMRKRLFLGMFTNLFTGIVKADPASDSLKPLALMFIRYLRCLIDGRSGGHQDMGI